MNNVICTCITNGYDIPKDNFEHKINFEYILFSDKPIQTKSWKNIVYNPEIQNNKKQRYIKTHLTQLLNKYNLICYIDGNIDINDKLYKYIKENENNLLTFKKHPHRDCIYDEFNACVKCKKETLENCNKLKERYQKENYPKHNGLFETNIIIVHTGNEKINELFEKWWEEIFNNSHRDQLSLNYVIWKYHFEDIISCAISNDFQPKKHKNIKV